MGSKEKKISVNRESKISEVLKLSVLSDMD